MEQYPKKLTPEEYRDNLVKIINEKEDYLKILEQNYSDNVPDPKSLIEEINEVKEKIESLEARLAEHDKKY